MSSGWWCHYRLFAVCDLERHPAKHIAFAWVVVEIVKLWLLMSILVKALVKERRLENSDDGTGKD